MNILRFQLMASVVKNSLITLCVLIASVTTAASRESTSTLATIGEKNSIAGIGLSHELLVTKEACFRIDKITGHAIPCTSHTSGGRGNYDPPEVSRGYTLEAFSYFNADYSDAEFNQDPDSVIINAYLLSQLSAISYRNPGYGVDTEGEQAFMLAEGLGLEHLGDDSVIEKSFSSFLDLGGTGGESLAYIFYNDHAVFVVFQGSKGWLDWEESNIDFWPYAKPEWGHDDVTYCIFHCVTFQTNVVTIHNGFYDAMDIIFDEVAEAIEPLLEGRKLWITGHSLGGAVAVLTAFRLEHDLDIPVQGVHVFGAPAVGNSDWENAFAAEMTNVHRWGVDGDPAPLATQAPMFYHVGFINNLYENGDTLLHADESEMLGFSTPCLWVEGPHYGAVVRHMSYWPRMHTIFADHHPYLASQLPDSLPGADGACE